MLGERLFFYVLYNFQYCYQNQQCNYNLHNDHPLSSGVLTTSYPSPYSVYYIISCSFCFANIYLLYYLNSINSSIPSACPIFSPNILFPQPSHFHNLPCRAVISAEMPTRASRSALLQGELVPLVYPHSLRRGLVSLSYCPVPLNAVFFTCPQLKPLLSLQKFTITFFSYPNPPRPACPAFFSPLPA